MFSADLEETKIEKPCPFCGSRDIYCSQNPRDAHWFIECPICSMVFKSDERHRMSRESTIKHWNARAEASE